MRPVANERRRPIAPGARAGSETDEVLRGDAPHLLLPVAPTERDVDVLADGHLRALPGDLAVGAKAHHHRRLSAAAADRAHLPQFVGERQQRAAAGKQVALEIRPQAVAHDRNVEPVGDACELPNLLFLEELRFVDEHAMRRGMAVVLAYALEQVVAGAEHLGIRFQPDARRDVSRRIVLAIVAGDEQHGRHAALSVIVRGLQQHRRLAGIHRGVVEVKLGHSSIKRNAPPNGRR